jgi:hypothetical protein
MNENPYQSPTDGGAAFSLAIRPYRWTRGRIACGLAVLAMLLVLVGGLCMASRTYKEISLLCVPMASLCHMTSALVTLYDLSLRRCRVIWFLVMGVLLVYLPVVMVLLYWIGVYDLSRTTLREKQL